MMTGKEENLMGSGQFKDGTGCVTGAVGIKVD